MINNNNSADVIIDGKTVTVVPQNVSCLISRPNGTCAVAFEDGTVKDLTLSDFNKLKELNYNMAGGGIGSHGIVSDSIVRMEHTGDNTLLIDGTPFEGGGGGNVTQNRFYDDNEKCWVAETLLGDSRINKTVVSNNEVDIFVGNNVGQDIILFDYDSDHHLEIGSHEIVKRDNDGRCWILGQEIETGGGSDIYFDSVNKKIKGMKDENGNDVEISVNTMVVTL